MKKVTVLVLVIILITSFIIPINIEAQTIASIESDISKYKAQLADQEGKINLTSQELKKVQNKISQTSKEIAGIEQEMATLQKEINESNLEIERKTKESEEIVQYFQLSDNENVYLEYVFDSDTLTDMVYRMAIVEQLTAHNQTIMEELRVLIEANNVKKASLEENKKQLGVLKKSLETERTKLNVDIKELESGVPGLEDQIKSLEKGLKRAKNLGCGRTEDIGACEYRVSQNTGGSGSIPSTNGFYRPMQYGYVTQEWMNRGHLGMDLGSSNKTIPIYPIANGTITTKYYDNYGALVVKIRHNHNGRYIYSTYAHLSRFANISVGQYVTHNTQIGNMGNTGYSFGSHLHLEITSCDWHHGTCSWSTYQKSTMNPRNYIHFPASWTNR